MRTLFILTFFLFSSVILQNYSAMNTDNETRIYPNPLVLGQDLHVESNSEIVSVEVLDIIGKVIQYKQSDSFDAKSLSMQLGQCKHGVYIVKVKFNNNKYVIKKLLVKNP